LLNYFGVDTEIKNNFVLLYIYPLSFKIIAYLLATCTCNCIASKMGINLFPTLFFLGNFLIIIYFFSSFNEKTLERKYNESE